MKRNLTFIDPNKWYHIETIKKFLPEYSIEIRTYRDPQKKPYNIIEFRRGWGGHSFLEHPKTKRIRLSTGEAYSEAGYV